jgi:hypothetical protein
VEELDNLQKHFANIIQELQILNKEGKLQELSYILSEKLCKTTQ